MKKVQMYQADDGSLHETEEQCRDHDQKVSLRGWYDGNELLGNYAGSRVDYDDLVEWITTNQDKVKQILKHYET